MVSFIVFESHLELKERYKEKLLLFYFIYLFFHIIHFVDHIGFECRILLYSCISVMHFGGYSPHNELLNWRKIALIGFAGLLVAADALDKLHLHTKTVTPPDC